MLQSCPMIVFRKNLRLLFQALCHESTRRFKFEIKTMGLLWSCGVNEYGFPFCGVNVFVFLFLYSYILCSYVFYSLEGMD